MLSPLEDEYIREYAYVPEHLTGYVGAISQAEPFLLKDYLCYYLKGHLIFIGYPLKEPFEEKEMKKILNIAIERFNTDQIALIAPVISIPRKFCSKSNSDHYYKLDLSKLHICRKLRNMIKRASREVYIEKNQEIRDEHTQLISEFLSSHNVEAATRYIFERIPKYISSAPLARGFSQWGQSPPCAQTALVFSARDRDKRLVAFDIFDFGARDYAFYMFNFISRRHYVPGASDLLLYELIKAAREQGKSFINLGLGINQGVTFFKKKWGGIPFLNYEFCLYHPASKEMLKSLFQKL